MVPQAITHLGYHRVDLKRVPPKVSSGRHPAREAARKDSAVHVSLSSDSPVKQPGISTIPPPEMPKSIETPSAEDSRTLCHSVSVRSF